MVRFSLCFALAAAACAAPKPDAKTAQARGAGSGSGVVCHEVNDTGSLFSHTECTPVDQAKDEADRNATERFVKTSRATPSGVH